MILVQMKMPKWLSTLVLLSTFKLEPIKIVKCWVILLSWIRIRILNADPDQDPADPDPKHCLHTTADLIVSLVFFLAGYVASGVQRLHSPSLPNVAEFLGQLSGVTSTKRRAMCLTICKLCLMSRQISLMR